MDWVNVHAGIPAIGDLCLVRLSTGYYDIATYMHMTEEGAFWYSDRLGVVEPTHWKQIRNPTTGNVEKGDRTLSTD